MSISLQVYDHFYWLASDSWGAKNYPIEGQEFAAEGVVTVLPQRKAIEGVLVKCDIKMSF